MPTGRRWGGRGQDGDPGRGQRGQRQGRQGVEGELEIGPPRQMEAGAQGDRGAEDGDGDPGAVKHGLPGGDLGTLRFRLSLHTLNVPILSTEPAID